MNRLVSILRAAHCRSTHHFFAIDALEWVQGAKGLLLRDMLLDNYSEYLKGAKDPDDVFKDFQNHVLHVSDNLWGGAPQACEKWLVSTITFLQREDWAKAAYACGVLSHYFTDPTMPLHTGQTERESIVHRPMEWSICKSYEDIYQMSRSESPQILLQPLGGTAWIGHQVTEAARVAHSYYDRLIKIYDVENGCIDPPRGLNEESRMILAKLFAIAIHGWAAVISRIAEISTTKVPTTTLTLATIMAGVQIPVKSIVSKIGDKNERLAINNLLSEYTATGTVKKNLPPEVKSVRKEREKNPKPIPVKMSAQLDADKPVFPELIEKAHPKPRPIVASIPVAPEQEPLLDMVRPPRISVPDQPVQRMLEPIIVTPSKDVDFKSRSIPLPTPAADLAEPTYEKNQDSESLEKSHSNRTSLSGDTKSKLNRSDNIVDAPSIGPKTAVRFEQIGINTIEQFLTADVQSLAEALETKWITADLLQDWQDQARLVCDVPALCGYKAQLLVAVDCRNADELASCDREELYTCIERFCETKEADRILRSSSPPDADEIEKWILSSKNGQMRKAS